MAPAPRLPRRSHQDRALEFSSRKHWVQASCPLAPRLPSKHLRWKSRRSCVGFGIKRPNLPRWSPDVTGSPGSTPQGCARSAACHPETLPRPLHTSPSQGTTAALSPEGAGEGGCPVPFQPAVPDSCPPFRGN